MTKEILDYIFSDEIVEGLRCLSLGIPWQVPESIVKEDELLRKDDVYFEVGAGGSTIFAANRCKEVISVEASSEWEARVIEKVNQDGLVNVTTINLVDEEEICGFIKNMDKSNITVVSVDPEGNFNRSNILNSFLWGGVCDKLRMIVMDNYSHPGIFPDHYSELVIDSPDWEVFTFNHIRWAGDGTRIYVKKD